MGDRGPQSSKVTPLHVQQSEPPKPLRGMSKESKRIWKSITDNLPPDYFRPADLYLLRSYCEWAVKDEKAERQLEEQGEVIEGNQGPKRNPWLDIKKEAASVLSSLATKLRLCPNARYSYKKADTETKEKPKSKRKNLMFNG